MNKLLLVLIMLSVCLPITAAAENTVERQECHVCGMYIDQFQSTATQLTLKGGERYETCGVACMLRFINDRGGPDAFSSLEVHDWTTKTLTPAAEASYVIGSRIVPDMMPNLIAFKTKEDAEAFRAKEGGELLTLSQALLSISPMGMTMPTRIKTAVVAPKGSLAVGGSYMHMTMDKVKLGSDSVDPLEFVRRPGQMMGPKKMTVDSEMLMATYGLTDDLSLSINAAYLQKKMESYRNGGAVTDTTKNYGFGDIDISARYNLWKNTYYSKFFSLLVGTTLPTGDFKKQFINMPGLQVGTGDFTFTGGLLFSHRYKNFWFHYLTSYTTVLENGDDYKFGDTARVGAAIHYTPNYDLMVGLEVDGASLAKDEYLGNKLANTGGFRSNLSGVAEWRFLTALGGNFSVRGAGGMPIYEDLNHRVGLLERPKLGGGYFVSGSINYSRRFPLF
ncbi:MAG TPA: nitrous oxide reductase accessory protein NosL [Geobacterales bacterium]|nr:nitrous oxide reductase accessory protein NosL [Geobacterales bacterium]